MPYGGYGGADRSTQAQVEVLLRAHTGAAQSLAAELANVQGQMDRVATTGRAAGKSAVELAQDLQGLANRAARLQALLDEVARQTSASAGGFAQLQARLGLVGTGVGSTAYKFQQFAYLLDDMQYVGEQGLRPIINNLVAIDPKVGLVVLAFDLARKAVAGLSGEAAKAENPIEALKEKVKELSEKPIKLTVDLDALNEAESRLETLEARQKALDAAKVSDAQADLAKAVTETAKTTLGGTGGLYASVKQSDAATGYRRGSLASQEEVDRAQYQVDHPERDIRTGAIDESKVEGARRALDAAKAKLRQEQEQSIKDLVADFLRGEAQAIATFKQMSTRTPEAFARVGPEGVLAREAIANLPADAGEMQHRSEVDREIKETDEADDENRKAFDKAKREAKSKRQEAERAAHDRAARTRAEVDSINRAMGESEGDLYRDFANAIQAARISDEMTGPEKTKAVEDTLKEAEGANLTDDHIVAIRKATNAALTAIRKAEARAGEKSAKATAQASAKREREAQAAARGLAPGYSGKVEAAILTNEDALSRGGGVDRDALVAEITRRVAFDLKQAGSDPNLAKPIVDQAGADLLKRVGIAQGQTGDIQSAMASVLGNLVAENERIRRQQADTWQRLMAITGRQAKNRLRSESTLTPGRDYP